jgi:Kef-type K+ transport system membrane component KefB
MAVTLALAVLLAVGFLAAKAAQLVRLPSVTGYICAGLLLGPSVLNVIKQDTLEHQLGHFTQIALMLIAFGIGEHLDLRQLRHAARSVSFVGLGEASGAFLLIAIGSFFVARATGIGEGNWTTREFVALALLLGAVGVATAPAATLHVMRELGARGPLTTTLMAVVAVDDGLAIAFFGIGASAARQVVGAGGHSAPAAVADSLLEIVGSLLIGVVAGLIIDFVVHRLKRRGEMLTAGLALLLLAGESARLIHLSPLLAGMAAGFTIVNRDRRDVRVFRAINDFEPPIYALFFTLAGAHLRLAALAAAGALGLVYALLRVAGKTVGANAGARLAKAPAVVRRWLGLALVPQAGVAIGLLFLIQGDEQLTQFSSVITPVVLGAVVLSELVGPACARLAVLRAGEVGEKVVGAKPGVAAVAVPQLAPWNWGRLAPIADPKGHVLFGVSDRGTAGALARIATLLAHYHRAKPLAVHVTPHPLGPRAADSPAEALFAAARAEAANLGYEAETLMTPAPAVGRGIIAAARERDARAIVLGHPRETSRRALQKVVEVVGREAPCPVIVVRLAGVLHTERILVPLGSLQRLDPLETVIRALAAVGPHQITLLRMLPPEAAAGQLEEAEDELRRWVAERELPGPVSVKVVATEARVEAIVGSAREHDLLLMRPTPPGLRRAFFGSLAEDVAQRCGRPMLMVHVPEG